MDKRMFWQGPDGALHVPGCGHIADDYYHHTVSLTATEYQARPWGTPACPECLWGSYMDLLPVESWRWADETKDI